MTGRSLYVVCQMIASLLKFAGADQRQEDIFENENFIAKSKNLFKGLKVECPSVLNFTNSLHFFVGRRKRLYPTSTTPFHHSRPAPEGEVESDKLSIHRWVLSGKVGLIKDFALLVTEARCLH